MVSFAAPGSLQKLIGWSWEYCSLFCWCRETCVLSFPNLFEEMRKAEKTHTYSGLARFKYQLLLAFHWCSAAFARLSWEPLQHTNLQSADTYAMELKVFFVYQEPFRASLHFLHWFRLLSELPLTFHQSSAAKMRHCYCEIPNSFYRWACCMEMCTFIITVPKNYYKKTSYI